MTIMTSDGIRPLNHKDASFPNEVTGATAPITMPPDVPNESATDRDARGQLAVGQEGIRRYRFALQKLAKV